MEKMEHKACGFRDKVHVCTFRPEDCNAKECDFYDIEFDHKVIRKMMNSEKREAKKLHKQVVKLRKDGLKATDEYKQAKKDRKDKIRGALMLAKAWMYLKRINVK